MQQKRVVLVGPGRQSRGGITSVLRTYANGALSSSVELRWLETQDARSPVANCLAFLRAALRAPFLFYSADIVHIHTASRLSFLRKSVFLILAKVMWRRVILHIHGGAFASFLAGLPFGLRQIVGSILRLPSAFVMLTPRKAAELAPHLGPQHITCIPNPVHSAQFETDRRHRHTCQRLLFVGVIEREKGVFDLIRAFTAVTAEMPELRLVMVGDGQIHECRALARSLGSDVKTEFTGWLTGCDLAARYHDADIFCLPSYVEGLPMSLLEAMTASLPIITTPVGGIPDAVRSEESAIFVDPGSVEGIAAAIRRLCADKEFRATLAANAHSRAIRQYSDAVVTDRLQQLYNSL